MSDCASAGDYRKSWRVSVNPHSVGTPPKKSCNPLICLQFLFGVAGHAVVYRPDCRDCGGACRLKDYRNHVVATPFGHVTLRLPRFCCAKCGTIEAGGRQVFGVVAKSDTDIKVLIGRSLDAVGRTEGTPLTAFTDGCSGLRRILADTGVAELPILDWFHIGMRLQHLKQVAGGLSADDPEQAVAKVVIVEEVERLHWRLWNGKAKDAQISIDRIRAVMHHFQGEAGGRKSIAPSRKLWTALQALDGYLTGQSDWMVNYAEWDRAGLRVSTAITEGTANFLVNRRMEKSQSMRWSRQGADLLLQVRCAVYNGTLGSGFGQKFRPVNDQLPQPAIAA
jgi:hypothetical protein